MFISLWPQTPVAENERKGHINGKVRYAPFPPAAPLFPELIFQCVAFCGPGCQPSPSSLLGGGWQYTLIGGHFVRLKDLDLKVLEAGSDRKESLRGTDITDQMRGKVLRSCPFLLWVCAPPLVLPPARFWSLAGSGMYFDSISNTSDHKENYKQELCCAETRLLVAIRIWCGEWGKGHPGKREWTIVWINLWNQWIGKNETGYLITQLK